MGDGSRRVSRSWGTLCACGRSQAFAFSLFPAWATRQAQRQPSLGCLGPSSSPPPASLQSRLLLKSVWTRSSGPSGKWPCAIFGYTTLENVLRKATYLFYYRAPDSSIRGSYAMAWLVTHKHRTQLRTYLQIPPLDPDWFPEHGMGLKIIYLPMTKGSSKGIFPFQERKLHMRVQVEDVVQHGD